MARILWDNPATKEFHRQKATKQWEETDIKEKFVAGVLRSNRKRIKNNPNMMIELAQKSAVSLHKKWQRKDYKTRVIKSKILGFTNKLFSKFDSAITP